MSKAIFLHYSQGNSICGWQRMFYSGILDVRPKRPVGAKFLDNKKLWSFCAHSNKHSYIRMSNSLQCMALGEKFSKNSLIKCFCFELLDRYLDTFPGSFIDLTETPFTYLTFKNKFTGFNDIIEINSPRRFGFWKIRARDREICW